jgi:hypothetical protein
LRMLLPRKYWEKLLWLENIKENRNMIFLAREDIL